MAEDLIRVLITQATSILVQNVRVQLKLVVNVKGDINHLINTLSSIQASVGDAERRQIENQTIKEWVKDLKFTSYDIEDTLTDWSLAIREVNGNLSKSNIRNMFWLGVVFSCFCSNRIGPLIKVAVKIRDIKRTLVCIDNAKNAFKFASNTNDEEAPVTEPLTLNESTSFLNPLIFIGRDQEKDYLLSTLKKDTNASIIFIWGMGGIGKTSLAQMIFNCVEVQNNFMIKIWVGVGRTSVTSVVKAILKNNSHDTNDLQTLLECVSRLVDQKKYFLVLDNVWEEDVYNDWNPLFVALNKGAPGSKILITSRNEGVGKKINAIVVGVESAKFMPRLGELSDDDTWTIFSRLAFSGRNSEFYENFKDIGREISNKCKGLPLAAETIGSLMVLKDTKDEWERVLNDKIWQLELADGLSNPLLLSYYDLPAAMKRCFCYCANFAKGSTIDACNLIQMWMSQGYLGSDGKIEMEITGRGYLNSLIRRSLFQDPEKNKEDGTILRFKMHDMVHDVASYLMENECLLITRTTHIEVDQNPDLRVRRHYRHLTITREDDATFPVPPNSSERLYTFSIKSFHDCPPIVVAQDCVKLPPNFLDHFKYLKTLDLSRNMLLTIPDDVQNLKNLCYLDLSHNPFYNLPETVCSFLNLQTLKLLGCHHLTELPQSIGKLEKLRHLDIDQTSSLVMLPKGVAKLTSLRTLSKFLIGNEDGFCSLGDLKQLNHLRGRLKIEGLNEVHVSEVDESELENKEHLVDLHINCSMASEVIDAFRLNKKLGSLQIDHYGGKQFPNWMASVNNLKKLRLQEWDMCVCFPPLGKLPLLKVLHIEGFKALTNVDSEFLEVETDAGTTVFPKLEKLKFSQMEQWEKWDVIKGIKIMPCLRYLKLSHCNILRSLPQEVLGLPIKKLRIRNCVILKQRYQKETGVDREMVSHISSVRIL